MSAKDGIQSLAVRSPRRVCRGMTDHALAVLAARADVSHGDRQAARDELARREYLARARQRVAAPAASYRRERAPGDEREPATEAAP